MKNILVIMFIIVSFVAITLSGDDDLSRIFVPCGDVNLEDGVNIFDATYLIAFLYNGGPEPTSIMTAL